VDCDRKIWIICIYIYIYVYIWLPYYSIIDGLLIDNMDIIDNEITVYIYIYG